MKLVNKIMLLFVLIYLTCNVSAFENELANGSVYFNDKKCTVYDAELKVGEPATIKAVVYLKKNVDVSTALSASGFGYKNVDQPFEVIKGSSEFTDTAREFDHNAGETVTFEWIVRPTDEAAGWTIPLNIAFTFYDRDEKEGYPFKFTAANIVVHNEHYSGPTPTRTAADPSSTDQPPSQGSPGFGAAGALLGIALVVMARRS
ncbi:MAG: sarcinarray family MAST domain-containing protein [ANME-2 cluster archaeon]|nr:sarcinarray family MAST domain-containing protein [ANME-2 cluster archaeon]MBC2706363.1 sarcinarray family MAST domain-containing protein [ANME-2 cluster archaeon]